MICHCEKGSALFCFCEGHQKTQINALLSNFVQGMKTPLFSKWLKGGLSSGSVAGCEVAQPLCLPHASFLSNIHTYCLIDQAILKAT